MSGVDTISKNDKKKKKKKDSRFYQKCFILQYQFPFTGPLYLHHLYLYHVFYDVDYICNDFKVIE